MTDGYQAVSLALRAPRVAVLFSADGDWASWAAHALARMGQYWGGAGFILVPYGASGVSASMLATTAAYDPDYVVLTERSISEAEAVHPGALKILNQDGVVSSGGERRDLLFKLGTDRLPDESGFKARSQVVRVCNSYRQTFMNTGLGEEDLDEPAYSLTENRMTVSPLTHLSNIGGDPAAFGLGHTLNAGPLWTLAVATRVGFHDSPTLPIRPDNTSPVDEAVYRYAVGVDVSPPESLRVGPGVSSVWDRTTTGLLWTDRPTRRTRHLVVLGRTAEDYCQAFAWQRMYGAATWLPIEELPNQGSPEFSAIWILGQSIKSESIYSRRETYISSWSLESDTIVAIQNELIDGQGLIDKEPEYLANLRRIELARVIRTDQLDWPVGRKLSIARSYDHTFTLPASFDDDGTVRLLDDLPRLEPSEPELDQLRDWEMDVSLEQRIFPFGRQFPPAALVRQDSTGFSEAWIRSGLESFSVNSRSHGLVYSSATRRQSMPRTRLVQPGFRGWVAAQAETRGVRTDFSDAGRRVEVLRRLWGSRADLISNWSSMHKVFRSFVSDQKTTSDAFPDGGGVVLNGIGTAYLTFDGMIKAMDAGGDKDKQNQLREWVDNLVAFRVLRRGVILGCKECTHVEFFAVAALGDSNDCGRCGAANQMMQERWSKTRSEKEPPWFYDLHQAARSLMGADGGVSLLAADYLARNSDGFDSVAEMDFFDRESGTRLAEIDLIACAGDRLIVAEAKTVPKLGTKKERLKKVTALTTTAKLLQADEILLCSAQPGPWTQADLEALALHVNYEFPEYWRRPRARLLTGLDSAEPTYQSL